jgi:hypothetical protein
VRWDRGIEKKREMERGDGGERKEKQKKGMKVMKVRREDEELRDGGKKKGSADVGEGEGEISDGGENRR